MVTLCHFRRQEDAGSDSTMSAGALLGLTKTNLFKVHNSCLDGSWQRSVQLQHSLALKGRWGKGAQRRELLSYSRSFCFFFLLSSQSSELWGWILGRFSKGILLWLSLSLSHAVESHNDFIHEVTSFKAVDQGMWSPAPQASITAQAQTRGTSRRNVLFSKKDLFWRNEEDRSVT